VQFEKRYLYVISQTYSTTVKSDDFGQFIDPIH